METVESAIYRLRVEGQEQLGKLKSELDGVTVSEEKAAGASRTTTQALQNRLARLDPLIKAQQQYAKELEAATRFAQSGVGSDAQRAAQIDLATRRYNEQVAAINKVEQATGKFATQTGLARHELINLSRQAQDVVVSLQGGQGLGTVMLQQGSQILDVLGTSRGGIGGAVSELAARFRGLFTVGRVAFAGIATAVGGAAYATASYLSEQKELERSLIGNRASPGAINAIAGSRSSSTGLSVSETREAAIEFAKTGQIHSRVIGDMIETTKNFTLVTGQSSKEAAHALASAFTNIQGIDNLNKQFNFLDGNTRRVVENMLLAGRTSEAAALANEKLASAMKGVEGTQGLIARGWTAISNAASNAADVVGEKVAKYTGLRNTSKTDRAIELDEQISGLEGMGAGDKYFEATLQKLKSELKEIRSELSAEHWGKAFNALSSSAAKAVAATDPLRASLDQIVGKLTQLRDAQAAGINVPGLQQAVQYYEQIAQHLQNQMQAQDAIAAKYPGMTLEFAKQVEALEQQNRLLKARENGTEASVSAAIAYENAIAAGANSTEAAAIKAMTLKNNLMQAAQAASSIQIDLDWSEFDAAVSKEMSRENNSFLSPSYKSKMGANNSNRSTFQVNPVVTPFGKAVWTDPELSGGAFTGLEAKVTLASIMSQLDALRQGEIQYLSGGSKEQKLTGMTMQIEELFRTLGDQPENIWQIRSLERSMMELRDSVDENTSALDKVTLNPLYNGRDALKVGYMHAARGLDFIAKGPPSGDQVPVHLKVNGGERVTVTPAGSASDNSRTTSVTNNIVIGGPQSTNRRSSRQLAQRYGQLMHSLS